MNIDHSTYIIKKCPETPTMASIELYVMKKLFYSTVFRVILRFKVIAKLNYHYLLSSYCMTFDIL